MAMEKLPLSLWMEYGPGEGKSFEGTKLKRVTIGRTRTNNYQIKDPTVSQKHAIIEWRVDRWTVVDVGSSNGTAVNGVVLKENEPVALRNGDVIRFGEAIKVRVQIDEYLKEDVVVVEDEEDEDQGIAVENWFEQERLRIVQTVQARRDATILEMKRSAEQLKKMFREHAGVVEPSPKPSN